MLHCATAAVGCRNLQLGARIGPLRQAASSQASSSLSSSFLVRNRPCSKQLAGIPSTTRSRVAAPGRAFAIQELLNKSNTGSSGQPSGMARKFIVGGNHKCNGTTDSLKKLAEILNAATMPGEEVVEVVIAPPSVYLPLLKSILRKDIYLAAQNMWVGKGGAYTGEISAEMLVNLDIPWVILGHSERRTLIKESNEFVADKVAYALSQGLKVIACVGESLEERESGQTITVVATQLKAIADKISSWDNVVLAYEPIWAIGTGKVATPQQAQETHADIRKWLAANVSADVAAKVRIQYGGSVTAANCKDLAALPDVDGFLVGGASLKPEFVDIINSATVSKSA